MNHKKNQLSKIESKNGTTNHKQSSTAPLYEKLLQYASSGQRSFHVPGHKNGAIYQSSAISETFGQDVWEAILRIDVTEIEGTDDLHHPEEVILEGQQLAAACFGAEESHWLVGGSTSGNLALLLTVCTHPGDIVIVQRNVHKSIIHGLMMAGAKAVFLTPVLEPQSTLAVIPDLQSVQQALRQYPDAKAVMLTSPNYYGVGADLTAIAAECHAHHIPLFIDEAHGAHYGHHSRFPSSALKAGADGVVQSTHKMLAAMTMGAMLHIQGPRINRTLSKQRLSMLQSSSPSYPIMASLDLSRYLIDQYGTELFEKGLEARDSFVQGIAESDRFEVLKISCSDAQHRENKQTAITLNTDTDTDTDIDIDIDTARGRLAESSGEKIAHWTQDPFKVVIYDRMNVLSGTELQKLLEQHGCFPEMSDDRYVVLVFSLGSRMEDTIQALQALQQIEEQLVITDSRTQIQEDNRHEAIAETVFSYSDTLDEPVDTKRYESDLHNNRIPLISEPVEFTMIPVSEEQIEAISLEQANGRRSAEMIIPYPPGIPILYPGEYIGEQVHAQLMLVRNHHMKVQGAMDTSLNTIRVYI
ncbi:aminotransferase class I/II-fold pyridoxal phosphate-dependent enzyme [Paenibacillus bovis]|uniref:Amino acid decarboxylase n=1 Tax=Paenibacillus bovis TaxID=1616788 RepID=A0A172ZC57_9BACL|nr:aminotransferase class I/II-fold pyridoxal phosphate-dependent enzyme [Paenibacillus bovis]ANF95093.1 amino acid decarboxylase [Paenibacillus bovis]